MSSVSSLRLLVLPYIYIDRLIAHLTLREVLMESMDLLLECGYTKPIPKVVVADKTNIIQTITLHKAVLVSLAELLQFRKGLSSLGVAGALKDHSIHFFVYKVKMV